VKMKSLILALALCAGVAQAQTRIALPGGTPNPSILTVTVITLDAGLMPVSTAVSMQQFGNTVACETAAARFQALVKAPQLAVLTFCSPAE
jgi:hypothetical protein